MSDTGLPAHLCPRENVQYSHALSSPHLKGVKVLCPLRNMSYWL